MSGLSRALLWTAVEKYLGLGVGLVLVAVMSRLLTPREIGVSAVGVAMLGVAEALRDFGATAYLIQRRDVTIEVLRATFTLLLLCAVVLTSALFIAAPALATAYDEPGLALYIQVVGASFLLGPIAAPIMAILRRDMQFDRIASINVAGSIVNAVCAIGLGLAGFSYMCIAWAGLASAMTVAALALWYRPYPDMFRLRLRGCGEVFTFGTVATVTVLVNKVYEALPMLILGRILPFDAVGLLQRAMTVCQLPERFMVAVVGPVALPAFAAAVRSGDSMKQAYLGALGYVTAVYWPALMMVVLLAYPIVRIMLGPQWLAAAPLVQIMASALLVMFPAVLTFPLLVSIGRIKDTMWSSLISLPLSVVFLVPAAFTSLHAVALSMLLTLPLQVLVALLFIRRHVPFAWRELATSLKASALVAMCTLAGPLVVLSINAFALDMSLVTAGSSAGLAIFGWLAGLWLSGHPLRQHLVLGMPGPLRGFLATRLSCPRGMAGGEAKH